MLNYGERDMYLPDVLRSECIRPGFALATKAAALREVAKLAKASFILNDISEEVVLQGLLGREELGSTGFGDGIAIPHCRLEGVKEFVVGFLTVPNGVDFDALDEEKSTILVFIIAPADESKEHVRVLSAVSQVLNIPGVVDELVAATTVEAARESFVRHVKDDVETKGHDSRNQLTLFIQEEDLFQPLLNVFASINTCSFVVVESQNATSYFASVPLFAGFWSDSHVGFSRIIVGAIEKGMTNEIIRQIERVTGCLDERDDVMLLVQNVFYASGALGE